MTREQPTVALIQEAIIEAKRAELEQIVLYLLEMALLAALEAEDLEGREIAS